MSTSITPGQLAQVQKMARDKGIGSDRFQVYGLDKGIIATALDAVKLGRRIMIVPDIAPPPVALPF